MDDTLRAIPLALAFALTLGAAAPAAEPPARPAEAGPEEVVRALTRAIDHFDLDGFMAGFAAEITMFYPIESLGPRVDGSAALKATQERVFGGLAARFAEQGIHKGPYFGLVPRDLRTQMLGEDASVVTWHVDRPTHLGRRTAVLARRDGVWRIVSYHASNVPKPGD